MKTPGACTGLPDIRDAIDTLDQQIIGLMGQRLQYVLAASQFKPDLASIPAPERVAAMLATRRLWAAQVGLDPDFLEDLYRPVIQGFIQQQVLHWQRTRGAS